jgi:RNA polymerase sigma factor (sigma-70 family)
LALTSKNIETLIVLCRKGNQLAQLEVYNRYQKAMYNTAFRIVKNSAEAEDIMQESFITAFTKLDSFKGNASFEYHKSKRFVSVSEKEIENEVEDDFSISSEDITNTKVKLVLKCMDDLHDNYRQILTLHFIEGFDYEEICEILNISYANCRTLIYRAKESLRTKLKVSV